MPPARAFWPSVALVLLAHGAALTLLVREPGTRPGVSGVPQAAGAPVLQVRPVVLAARGAVPPEAAAAAREPPAAAGADRPLRSARSADTRTADPVAPPRAPVPDARTVPPPAAPQPAAAPAYLARGELTAPALLLSDVQVPFPDDVEGIVDLKVRVSLFVEADGSVARVRLDTPGVHPAFVRTVTEAFAGARFEPGRVGDQPVRALVRLEVEFHAPSGRRKA